MRAFVSPSPSLFAAVFRFDPYIRKALKDIIREYEPEFATTEGESKEFYVSFFNLDSRLK